MLGIEGPGMIFVSLIDGVARIFPNSYTVTENRE